MPELETRIREWKRSLAVAFGGSGEILEELESHLREEIDRLKQAGHEPDAALTAAQAKLGRPVDLAAEYAQAGGVAGAWLPISVGLALLVLVFGSITWISFVPAFLEGGKGLRVLHVATITAGYAAGFYAGLLGICYVGCWLLSPIGLGQRRSLGRTLFVANAGAAFLLLLGMVLGGVWTIGTLIPLLWFTALTAMLWTVPQKQHLWVLLSVLAISAGVWGWFGPALLSQQQSHSYGFNLTLLYFVVVCTAVPLAVALLGLLPPGRLRRQPT